MRRRTFLSALAAATGGSAAGIELTGRTSAASGQIPELEVYSSSSLVNANGSPLTDDSHVAVVAAVGLLAAGAAAGATDSSADDGWPTALSSPALRAGALLWVVAVVAGHLV